MCMQLSHAPVRILKKKKKNRAQETPTQEQTTRGDPQILDRLVGNSSLFKLFWLQTHAHIHLELLLCLDQEPVQRPWGWWDNKAHA